MKIVVASDGTQVTGHFGHCESFRIYETDNGAILSEETIPNPGHKPGFLPNFLADKGAAVLICGGLGASASAIFERRGVTVITGAQGDAKDAVLRYLKGELHSTGSICREHAHHHENCGE